MVGCSPTPIEPTLIDMVAKETFTPTETATPESTSTATATLTEEPLQYVTLLQPFTCGDGIVDIGTNASFNGLFIPTGFDQYHGHMDILLPDGCDINTATMLAPISGRIEKYTFVESDAGGTNWGYHLVFPQGVYPNGIDQAFQFAGIGNFEVSQIKRIILDIGHLDCITGIVTAGEPICTVIPMPSIYGETRVAMQVGIDLNDGKGFMFSPTLFQWTGPTWECNRVLSEGYCDPKPNFYAP